MRIYSKAAYASRYRKTTEAEAIGSTQTAKCPFGHYLRFFTDQLGRVHETCDSCAEAARSAVVAARAATERERDRQSAIRRQRTADAADRALRRSPPRDTDVPLQCNGEGCEALAAPYEGRGRPPRYCSDCTPNRTRRRRAERERAQG